jgi:transcriptional regulator
MRRTPHFLLEDVFEVKRLIRENPWGTFVAATAGGIVASHYPVLLEEDHDQPEQITVVSHVGRPDEVALELSSGRELLLVVQGPHGYISPGWYDEGDIIPTWNHVTAHLYGTPVLLSAEENYAVLCRLTDHFEHHLPDGRSLLEDEAGTRRTAKGTVGLRLHVDRFEARAKLSQNKADGVRAHITAQLAERNPALADEMRRHP